MSSIPGDRSNFCFTLYCKQLLDWVVCCTKSWNKRFYSPLISHLRDIFAIYLSLTAAAFAKTFKKFLLHHSRWSLDRAVRWNPRWAGGRYWSRHVWQHQPSHAAQSCLNRCVLWGRGLFAKTGGCIKKVDTDRVLSLSALSLLVSPALETCTATPSVTISHTQCQCLWGTVGSMPFSGRWPLNQDIPCYAGSGEGRRRGGSRMLSLSLRLCSSNVPPRGQTEGLQRRSSLQPVGQDWD